MKIFLIIGVGEDLKDLSEKLMLLVMGVNGQIVTIMTRRCRRGEVIEFLVHSRLGNLASILGNLALMVKEMKHG